MLPAPINDLVKSGIAIGTVIVGLFVWGVRLEFQVAQKAGREELDRARAQVVQENVTINRTLERLDERTQRTDSLVQKLVCRQFPADMGCRQ